MLQMLATNTVFFIGTGVACLVRWRTPTAVQTVELMGVGVVGGLAQFLVFEAARIIPASVMATLEYSALPWAFLLGYWIWSDIPAPAVFFGAGLIVLAGALLIRSERKSGAWTA